MSHVDSSKQDDLDSKQIDVVDNRLHVGLAATRTAVLAFKEVIMPVLAKLAV